MAIRLEALEKGTRMYCGQGSIDTKLSLRTVKRKLGLEGTTYHIVRKTKTKSELTKELNKIKKKIQLLNNKE